MKFSQVPEPIKSQTEEYIKRRFNEIVSIWNYWLEHCVKFISFMNAGGVIAILTFMGITKKIEIISLPGLALGLFVLGIFLDGILFSTMFNRMKNQYQNMNLEVADLFADKLDREDFLAKDQKRLELSKSAFFLGWGAAICFYIGVIIGLFSFFT
jgi:hypothetical protein